MLKKIQWPGPQITPNKTEKALDDWIGGSTHFQLMAAWPNFVIVFLTSFCDADNSFNLISPPPLIITQFKTIHFPWKNNTPSSIYKQYLQFVTQERSLRHLSEAIALPFYRWCTPCARKQWLKHRKSEAIEDPKCPCLRPAFNVILYESQFDLLWAIVIILNNSKNMYNFHF